MAQEIVDIAGNVYNKLTVLRFSHTSKINGRVRSYWVCRCKCGNVKTLRKDSFAYETSKVKSCGCWHIEETRHRKRNSVTGKYEKK